jgi:hypothetical protein
MVTGIASGAWGYSPESVAGMVDNLNELFTYQLSISSFPDNGSKTLFGKKKPRKKCPRCRRCAKCTCNNTLPIQRPFQLPVQQPVQRPIQLPVQTPKPYIYIPEIIPDNKGLYSKYSVEYNCSERDINKKLSINGKLFGRGSPAYYDFQKTPGGIVISMGCKQIIVKTENNIQKHVKLEDFFKYNS